MTKKGRFAPAAPPQPMLARLLKQSAFFIVAMLCAVRPEVAGPAYQQDNATAAGSGSYGSIAAAGFSSGPQMITEGAIDLPLKLLVKRGVDGTVEVEAAIDKKGFVQECIVRKSADPLLDSIVCESMMRSAFTPAYEEGRAVESAVAMSFTFDLASVVRNSAGAAPEIRGVVVEGPTSLPVVNAKVNLAVVDSTRDPDCIVPMGRYLKIIGTVPGQTEHNGILSTSTDSLGRFAFRLLPSCPVRLAVIAPGFEITHVELDVKKGVAKKVTCRLEPLEKDTAFEIVVYGTAPDKRRIDIEEEQVSTGLTHYLSDVLQTRTEVRPVPESKSMMMVRAGSPFDNRYFICGVPFIAPFHFQGHSYADIDGMMISALSEIDLTINGIAGKQIDASGFRVDAQPGIYRGANRKLLHRPELSVDFNTIGQDFLLSLARSKTDDCLQLGFTRAEKGTLQFLGGGYKMQENQFGVPQSYGNATLTGAGTLKSLHFDSFSWLAWDKYKEFETIPWGMAGITVRPSDKGAPVFCAGGSRQYFASGKRTGAYLYRKFVSLSNGNVSLTLDTLRTSGIDFSIDLQGEYARWSGWAERSSTPVYVPSINPNTGKTEYLLVDTAMKRVADADGNELSLQIHGFIGKTFSRVTAGINLLCAGLLYGKEPDVIGDAGISVVWREGNFQAGLYGGRVTSRPDIRGLPDSFFRRCRISAYLFAIPVNYRLNTRLKASAQPYLRWKTVEPKPDPVLQIWISDSSTALFAAGTDFDAEVQLFDWLALRGAGNIARGRRIAKGTEIPYEWDVPWTCRSSIHAHFGNEAQMHFYLHGIASKGMLFYDYLNYGFIRAPNYLRFDISMQYRSKFIDHSFLTRYDAYLNVFNLTDRFNVTDYYWDRSMRLHPIPQGTMMIEMGVRLGFRL